MIKEGTSHHGFYRERVQMFKSCQHKGKSHLWPTSNHPVAWTGEVGGLFWVQAVLVVGLVANGIGQLSPVTSPEVE